MKIFALIESNSNVRTLRFVTDDERRANDELNKAREKTVGGVTYEVLSTESFQLSSAGMASVSMDYELECLEETVTYRLNDMGISEDNYPAEKLKKLVEEIASKAYREITHYDVSEDYALNEAFEEYSSIIEAIQENN